MAHQSEMLIAGMVGIIIGVVASAALFVYLEPSQSFLENDQNQSPEQTEQRTALNPLQEDKYAASIGIVAVAAQTNEGITNVANVEIQPGKGRVLVAVNPFVEPDTQESAEIAAAVAERYTQKDLSNVDLIYSIESDAQLVGGPSAGAALTVATIAAIEKKTVRTDAAITGTIEPDGSIGPIGGVLEKTEAVAKAGKKLFLIPKGQGTLVYYEPKVTIEQRGRFQIQRTSYVPKQLDLIGYAKGELDLEVREVETVSEAAEILIS
ncbi:MAG: hypothetical protein J4215_06115 [Candidatus Diapherotrites archaeon]|uniref:Lon proteolytic domain-containing protein n=1 Tax=Candidatus Iainarchaeum sp. TaxID=3101447 RepID=A0A8T4L5K9_9ARCH|nr:hypothetical protein [Candidatus Diapherotrites archaeon]